jgi:hypothetical protein
MLLTICEMLIRFCAKTQFKWQSSERYRPDFKSRHTEKHDD